MTRFGPRRLLAAILATAILAAGCGGTLHEQTVEGVASYERGKESYDQKDYLDAISDLKAYVQQFPGTDQTDDALYYLGMAYFQTKDFVLASGQFDRLLRDFPASPRQPDALFQLARCDDLQSHPAPLDQTETLRAISRYKQFLDLYPENEKAPEARKRLAALTDRQAQKEYLNGRLYVRLKQYDSAIFYLTGVGAKYPTSQWCGQADILLAQIYLRRGMNEAAVAALEHVDQTEASAYVKRQASDQLRELKGQGTPR
jgi:outer membrane protein assembly factor BamD